MRPRGGGQERIPAPTGRRRLGLVAAAVTLLAAAPLSAVFATWTWLGRCVIAVALVAGAAALARSGRAPLWVQLVSMCGALLLALTWMFPTGDEVFGILPSPSTVAGFGDLVSQAADDVRSYGVPVPDRGGLLFVTVLGVGAVAILVDVLTVALRRPALAGLPMLVIYAVPVSVYVDSVPALPFTIGASGFLWLIAADNLDRVRGFGRRFSGDGRDVDVWAPSPLAAAGRRLSVVGVAAAVLLPLAVPGVTGSLLTRLTQTGAAGQGPGGLGGGQGRVNLFASLSGQLNQPRTETYLTVTTTEQDPFYLRIGVADVVSQQGFASRSPSGRSVARGLPDPRGTPRAGVTQQQFRARVEVSDAFAMPVLPTYTSITGMNDVEPNWLYDPDMQVVYSNGLRPTGKRYEFDYVRSSFTPQALRSAPPLADSSPLKAPLTAVPAVREVQDLVARLTRSKDTEYDKVRAIYDHFSTANGFAYSLTTGGNTSGTEIVSFLINKVGFCQQYAASMAWLVRAAGIPARVAFGFTRGEKRGANTYVVTNRNAHSWAEVYFEGLGWVPFDTTPAAAVVGSARTPWAPDADRTDAATPTPAPSAGSPGGAPSAGPRPVDERRNDSEQDNLGAAGVAGPTSGHRAWPAIAVAGLVLALLVVPAGRRALLRRRRYAAAKTQAATVHTTDAEFRVGNVMMTGAEAERVRADTHAVWNELIDTMIDYRVPADPTETPRRTADRLTHDAGLALPAAAGVMLLARAEERARYARDPAFDSELGPALTDVRKALSAHATWRTRLIATVLPPSVLLRWRLAVAGAWDRSVTQVIIRRTLSRSKPRWRLTQRPTR